MNRTVSRHGRSWGVALWCVATASCAATISGSGDGGGTDATHSDRSTPDSITPTPDAGTSPDTGTPPTDSGTGPDGFTLPGCDPLSGTGSVITVSPSPPLAPNAINIDATGPTGYVNIGLTVVSATRTQTTQYLGFTGTYVWHWTINPAYTGDYCITFTSDNGASVHQRLPIHIGGTDPVITPGAFVTRSGSELMTGSTRLRYVGMNLRGLPQYGTPLLPYANVGQIDTELAEVQRMGARVVRVFAGAHDANAATVAARLGRVLDSAQSHSLYVIVTLTDFYNTGFSPQGDDGYYDTSSGFSIPLLNPTFFRSGYTSNYLPWVRTVVSAFATHPAVFAWELGNEIKCDADHAAFASFAQNVSNTIRSIDSMHLIASGMITAAWMSMSEAMAFYANPNMDVITLHTYDGSHAFDDSWLSTALNKPMIIEEAGWSSGNRPSEVAGDIGYWVGGRGARGYMQWGFTVITPDNGNGDGTYGMDHLSHAGDYAGLFSTYSSQAASIR